MILYRQKNMHPSDINQALVTAWNQCELPTPDPPCSFVKDLEDKPQGELACQTDEQCSPDSTCFSGFCVSRDCLDQLNALLTHALVQCEIQTDPLDPFDVVCINQWSTCRMTEGKSESVCLQEVPCATSASANDFFNCRSQARDFDLNSNKIIDFCPQ